jgi:hypothetical protein
MLATVDDFVFGHALREAATDATIDIEFAAAQLATGAFPRLAEGFGGGRVDANKDRFERGLRALLEETRLSHSHLACFKVRIVSLPLTERSS